MNEYDRLVTILQEKTTLETITELLEWDQGTYMPSGQNSLRGKQMSVVAAHAHDLATSDELGQILSKLSTDNSLNEEQKFVVEYTAEDYFREKRVPRELVEKFENAGVLGYAVWEEAKKTNDFKKFSGTLKELVDLTRRMAEKKDPDKTPYESMLFDYDKDLTLEQVRNFFEKVKNGIQPVIDNLPNEKLDFLAREIDPNKQRAFSKYLLEALNFDTTKGRLDESPHPFTSAGRITTRYTDPWFEAVGSTIHEFGHLLYDQNRLEEYFSLPRGNFRSMSLHESQSRIWENHVGKNPAFWKPHFSELKKAYKPALNDMTFKDFVKEMHHAEKSLIRIVADELTYPMHIFLRFEIEQDLVSGKLKVDDLPEAWNAKMKSYLGIVPPDDAHGCLQDMHWCDGSFGYFPTYIIGSMISAQLYVSAKGTIPSLEQQFELGNTKPLADWLRTNIHEYGARYTTNALLFKATGAPLTPDYYISHLKSRYSNNQKE